MSRPYFKTWYCPQEEALSMIEQVNITSNSIVLEPSAGEGRIADLLYKRTANVTAIELHKPHFEVLKTKPYRTMNKNFLLMTEKDIGLFTHIVSCPPFDTSNHLHHMRTLLKNEGKLIALVMGNLLDDFWLQHYTEMNLDFNPPDGRMIRCGIVKYSHIANQAV